MPIDRNKLKKVVSGFSKEDREAFLDELGDSMSKAADQDILEALTGLSARVEALEKGITKEVSEKALPEDKKKKEKGFFDSINELLGGE